MQIENSTLARQVMQHPLLDRQKFLNLTNTEQDAVLKAILKDMARTRTTDELKATLGLLSAVVELGKVQR